jgi:2-phospho-L-lactate guanylyltransferase (CobY/MobA/RfbA family)
MNKRVVAVLARPSRSLPPELAVALLTDVIDLVADTPEVDSALVVTEGYAVAAGEITWPGTEIVSVAADPSVVDVLEAIRVTDAVAVAVVAADVPDLPTLLLGKLFSALAGPRGASVAVCPAAGGGLVAAAAMVPLSGWLRRLTVHFDDLDAVETLRAAAPLTELSIGPGWRRVRELGDLGHLDPGLEGWDHTRAYLAG